MPHTAANAPGAIHIVLQGKGGVGKSFVASHLAQYFADGAGARETLAGLVTTAENLAAYGYVVWLNSFFGPVVFDDKPFEETPEFSLRDRQRLGDAQREANEQLVAIFGPVIASEVRN